LIKHVKHYVCLNIIIYKSPTRDTHANTHTVVAKMYKSLRYYFKNLPEFMYYELAHYSVFDIEVDMRSYFETLYIDNTDHSHQAFKEMLRTRSIMGDMHTDRAFMGNSYWKVLMYKIILNSIQILRINN